jgi:biopolymer transport protein ExbB
MARSKAAARSGALMLAWALGGLALVAVWGAVTVRPAFAQDEEDIMPDEAATDTTEETPPVQSEAAPPAANGASTTDAADAAPTAAPRQSYLGWLYNSLGPLYSVIFLALSFALVALIVMNALMARRDTILPSDLIEGFEAQLNAKKYQEAYELAKNDESFLGKVLSAGLGRLSSGYPQAIEAMQEVGEEENMRLEHRLSYLALIGTISPMFGLLGTVHGMVNAFEEIARSTVSPKPAELADDIALALVTTLVGLWLAIPAIAAFNILRNRMAQLVLEVGIVSENLMSRFQNVGGQKTP